MGRYDTGLPGAVAYVTRQRELLEGRKRGSMPPTQRFTWAFLTHWWAVLETRDGWIIGAYGEGQLWLAEGHFQYGEPAIGLPAIARERVRT